MQPKPSTYSTVLQILYFYSLDIINSCRLLTSKLYFNIIVIISAVSVQCILIKVPRDSKYFQPPLFYIKSNIILEVYLYKKNISQREKTPHFLCRPALFPEKGFGLGIYRSSVALHRKKHAPLESISLDDCIQKASPWRPFSLSLRHLLYYTASLYHHWK